MEKYIARTCWFDTYNIFEKRIKSKKIFTLILHEISVSINKLIFCWILHVVSMTRAD